MHKQWLENKKKRWKEQKTDLDRVRHRFLGIYTQKKRFMFEWLELSLKCLGLWSQNSKRFL